MLQPLRMTANRRPILVMLTTIRINLHDLGRGQGGTSLFNSSILSRYVTRLCSVRNSRIDFHFALCLLFVPGIAVAQEHTGESTASVTVRGAVPHSIKVSAAELSRLPRRAVRARDHDGTEIVFEGVA